jgi:ABC-type glycerol-3-phosphate transport system substrate-binding protein
MKKTLILFLAAALLLPLAACGDTGDKPDAADPSATDAPVTGTQDAEDYSAYMPTADYDGYEFCILKHGDVSWCLDDVWAEGSAADAYSDAIFNRNCRIEAALDIRITQYEGVVDSLIQSSVMTGDDNYAIAYPTLSAAASLGGQDLLVDLKLIPEFHLDMPWWDAAAVDYLTIAGRLFFAESEINIQYDEATWVLYFCKSLIERYTLESPYELVRNNAWTMDKMHEMMTAVAHDEDGNGERNAPADYFGFSTHWGSYVGLLSGSGESLVRPDGEKSYVSNLYSERMISIAEKIGSIMNDMDATVIPNRFKGAAAADGAWAINTFYNEHSLFYGEVIGQFANLREMEGDFGLLPFPKYETTQEYYTCEVLNTAFAYVIPRSVQDKSRTATITEALAIDSHGDFIDAYLDTTITGKSMRDKESREMLQIIFTYRVYDLGDIFGWGGIADTFQSAVNAGGKYLASSAQRIESAFRQAVKGSMEAYAAASGW